MDRTRRSTRKQAAQDSYEGESSDGEAQMEVNLSSMTIESLKKYKKYYKLRTRPNNASKSEMLAVVQKHFQSMPVPDEAETIETFIYNIKYAQ